MQINIFMHIDSKKYSIKLDAPTAGPAGFIHSCRLPYVLFYFIFDLLCYFYSPFYYYIRLIIGGG